MYKFFINRPIVAMVIAIITVIIGLVTLSGLPIAQFPKIIPPEIFIQANYVGADCGDCIDGRMRLAGIVLSAAAVGHLLVGLPLLIKGAVGAPVRL